jgi:hypothetical protein
MRYGADITLQSHPPIGTDLSGGFTAAAAGGVLASVM